MTIFFGSSLFLRGKLEIDVLRKRGDVAADERAAIDVNRGRAVEAEHNAFVVAGVVGFLSVRRRQACLEGVRVQSGLRGKTGQFVPDIFRGDHILLVEDRVLHFPERGGRLIESAVTSERGRLSPGMYLG